MFGFLVFLACLGSDKVFKILMFCIDIPERSHIELENNLVLHLTLWGRRSYPLLLVTQNMDQMLKAGQVADLMTHVFMSQALGIHIHAHSSNKTESNPESGDGDEAEVHVENYIWYSMIVLLGKLFIFFFLNLNLKWKRL